MSRYSSIRDDATYETVDTGEDDRDLDLNLEGLVLALLYVDIISIGTTPTSGDSTYSATQ